MVVRVDRGPANPESLAMRCGRRYHRCPAGRYPVNSATGLRYAPVRFKKRPARHLFVYGSLRRDAPRGRHDLLAGHAEFIGPGRVRGRLYDLGDFPGLVAAVTRDEWVRGELYALASPGALVALDEYEDFDPAAPETSLFRRVRREVLMATGGRERAWVYEFAGPVAGRRRVMSGEWIGSDPNKALK